MLKKFSLILVFLTISITCLLVSSCDYGINNLEDSGEYNFFEGLDIKDVLDAKSCYEQLLKDLKFMNSRCYYAEKLAGSQAYTILMSYGLADMSQDASSLTESQLLTRANLFEAIKQINFYATSYDSLLVMNHTNIAIIYCNEMLSYFN